MKPSLRLDLDFVRNFQPIPEAVVYMSQLAGLERGVLGIEFEPDG
jgi:hypothetical protein